MVDRNERFHSIPGKGGVCVPSIRLKYSRAYKFYKIYFFLTPLLFISFVSFAQNLRRKDRLEDEREITIILLAILFSTINLHLQIIIRNLPLHFIVNLVFNHTHDEFQFNVNLCK